MSRFNSLIKRFSLTGLVLALSAGWVACSSENDDPEMPVATVTPQIIILYAPGGLGDQGYNDCILTGVQNFKKTYHNDVDMYQYSPGSIDEAQRLLCDWLSMSGGEIPALFVVASSDYEDLLEEAFSRYSLTKNKQVLFFESDNSRHLPVTTFRLSMYGASYLAGVTAAEWIEEKNSDSEAKDVLALLANPGDRVIASAGEGFCDGFRDQNPSSSVSVEYLASDWSGFVSAQIAYQRMSDWAKEYDFIFPVAGGSNQGIYRYTREHPDSPLTAGMDIDQSYLSHNITGSVVKHIDKVVFNYMETWLKTGSLPESAVLGLESGCIDWELSPYHPEFRHVVEQNRAEAIRKEETKL